MPELRIYGVIGEGNLTGEAVASWLVAHPNAPTNVRINSAGGSVLEGMAFYAAIARYKGRVTVHVDFLAASMASLIAMAGDEIVMHQDAMMMIHDPRSESFGTSRDLRKTANNLDKIANQLVEVYARRTKTEAGQMMAMMAAETWLDASETIELGFADRIEDPATAKMVACMPDLPSITFKNPPAAIAAQQRIGDKMPEVKEKTPADDPVASERQRAAKITRICDRLKKPGMAAKTVADGLTVEKARNKIGMTIPFALAACASAQPSFSGH